MSWRLVFFINLPIALGVVLISIRHVPESRDPSATGRLDLTGAALVTLGLVGLIYGLIEGPVLGWGSPITLIALLGGAGLLVAFVLFERRVARSHHAAGPLPLGAVLRGQRGDLCRLRRPRRGALSGARGAARSQRLQPARGRRRPSAGHPAHAAAVGPVRGHRGAARPAPADDGRPARRRGRVGPALEGDRIRQLRHRGAPGGLRFRARPGLHRRPAHLHGPGRRARRAHRRGFRHQQRRGSHGITRGGGGAARDGGYHRRQLHPPGRPSGLLSHGHAGGRGRVRGGRSAGDVHHPQSARPWTGTGRTRLALCARRPAAAAWDSAEPPPAAH